MGKQTFIDNMTERGYELKYSRNGNITPPHARARRTTKH